MSETQQFNGMNVLEHGISVHERFLDLYNHIKFQKPLTKFWRIPFWLYEPKLIENILPLDILKEYQVYHDLGKPYCRTVDENGQQHFPNHAEISQKVWNEISEDGVDSRTVGELIGLDMVAHTVRHPELDIFAQNKLAPSLLYTALAEVHSNAEFLGKFESDGFKIKSKQLDKVAKAILRVYNKIEGKENL